MYIYHITEKTTWECAISAGEYKPINFELDGFIHCSTKEQVIQVANRFYSNSQDLLLLWIDEEMVIPEIIYENLEGGVQEFPHIYGLLNLDAVQKVTSLLKNVNGIYIFPEI